jgi:hypothetical protein
MRTLANLLLIASLLTLPAFASAQNADPFGAGGDPRGADPFAGGKAKPPAVKPRVAKPPAVRNPAAKQATITKTVTKTKVVAVKASGKVLQLTIHSSSAAIQRIRAALDDETTQSFVELPLSDAVQQLSESHNIPIVIDNRALEERGLSAEAPVSLSLRKVSLRSFLRLMLNELALTYIIQDEVMQIMTVEAAEEYRTFEMYTFAPELTEISDKIVKALQGAVVPDTWDVHGGQSTITVIDNVLIVSAIEEVHERVIEFLEQLQQALN